MGGKVALCVNQEVGNVALDLRCKGFTEGFGGKVTVLPVSNEPAEGRAKVKAALSADSRRHDPRARGGNSRRAVPRRSQGSGKRVRSMSRHSTSRPSSSRRSPRAKPPSPSISSNSCRATLPVVFLANYARYGLIPGGNVPSGPNLITKDKAAQVVELSAKGIR